jgi:hypothetical protein
MTSWAHVGQYSAHTSISDDEVLNSAAQGAFPQPSRVSATPAILFSLFALALLAPLSTYGHFHTLISVVVTGR